MDKKNIMGKDITLSIPTRDRFELVSKVIASALTHATSPEKVEVIIRVDADDGGMVNKKSELPWSENIKFITGPRKSGYRSLHEFHNEVASQSTADWLFLLGDDCQITTPGWDQNIRNTTDALVLKHNRMLPNDLLDCLFCPIVNKKVYTILGHVSKHFFFDGYIYEYATKANILGESNINIKHLIKEAHNTSLRTDIDKSIEDWRKLANAGQDTLSNQKHLYLERDINKLKNYVNELKQ